MLSSDSTDGTADMAAPPAGAPSGGLPGPAWAWAAWLLVVSGGFAWLFVERIATVLLRSKGA